MKIQTAEPTPLTTAGHWHNFKVNVTKIDNWSLEGRQAISNDSVLEDRINSDCRATLTEERGKKKAEWKRRGGDVKVEEEEEGRRRKDLQYD